MLYMHFSFKIDIVMFNKNVTDNRTNFFRLKLEYITGKINTRVTELRRTQNRNRLRKVRFLDFFLIKRL